MARTDEIVLGAGIVGTSIALQLAKEIGAHHVVKADGNEVEAIKALTGGKGAEAVIDYVGEHGTTSKGLAMTRAGGFYYIVGYGEEIRISAADMIITERNIIGNLVGTWAELTELMALAERGRVDLTVKTYSLADANQALSDLHHGLIKGRGVMIP